VHGEAPNLLTYLCVHHVDEFIPWPVARYFEGGDLVSEIFLKLVLRAEDDLADLRVKSVCPDHQVKVAHDSGFESDASAVTGLLDARDCVVEDRFRAACDPVEDGCGQVAAREADVAALRQPGNCHDGESRDTFAGTIHDSNFLHHVAFAANLWQQLHAVSDIEAKSPEVDEVAAGPQCRGFFDDGGPHAVMREPVCEGGSGDSCAGD
jgi:hypothetical protein